MSIGHWATQPMELVETFELVATARRWGGLRRRRSSRALLAGACGARHRRPLR